MVFILLESAILIITYVSTAPSIQLYAFKVAPKVKHFVNSDFNQVCPGTGIFDPATSNCVDYAASSCASTVLIV